METSRRSFLRGVLALSVLPILPSISLASVPVIWGDGIHDDAPGLNALFAREPFVVEAEGLTAIDGLLHGGVFRVCGPLVISRVNFTISECVFDAHDLPPGSLLLDDHRSVGLNFIGNVIRTVGTGHLGQRRLA